MVAFRDRLMALVLALGMLAVLVTGTQAGPYEDAIARFTADSFDETIEAINGVAASGNPRAATIIEALQDGRLFFSAEAKRVFIKDKSDRLTDGRPAKPWPAAPRPISRKSGSTTGCGASS